MYFCNFHICIGKRDNVTHKKFNKNEASSFQSIGMANFDICELLLALETKSHALKQKHPFPRKHVISDKFIQNEHTQNKQNTSSHKVQKYCSSTSRHSVNANNCKICFDSYLRSILFLLVLHHHFQMEIWIGSVHMRNW